MNTAQLKPVENLELRNDSTDLSSTGKLDNSIWPNNSLLVIGLVSAILTLLGATLYAKKTSKKPS